MPPEPWKSPDWLEPNWTDRQVEVLNLIAQGRTNPQIGDDLGVSFAGAKWHVSEVLSKLGVLSRQDAAAYWRWHTSRRVRLKQFVRGFAALGLGKLALGGATLAVAGAAATGGVLWSLNDGPNDIPATTTNTGPALPTPTPTKPAVTASIDLNITQQVEEPAIFEDNGTPVLATLSILGGPGEATIKLQRVLETEQDTIACVQFGGVFVVRKHLSFALGLPSLVTAEGSVAVTRSSVRTGLCPNNSYLFEGVTGTVVSGGWLVFPYSVETVNGAVSVSGGLSGDSLKLPVPVFQENFIRFEWLSPAIDMDLAARAADFVPASWGAGSPYYGTRNRAKLGTFKSWDGDWFVSAFRHRGKICLLLHNPEKGYELGCQPNGIDIVFGSRTTGPTSYEDGYIRVKSAWTSGSSPKPGTKVPDGAVLLVEESFPLPDDFGEGLAFEVRHYEQQMDPDVVRRVFPPPPLLAQGSDE